MFKFLKPKTVIVGMSGGVDSSVAAALLKRQGYLVIGVYMKNWSEDYGDYGCTWAQDAEDARKVAAMLDIPFYVWNFEKEYKEKVVAYFLGEYAAGRTPNPDILCNSEIKFKVFLEKALALGADFVATGHYARVGKSGGRYLLLKGKDLAKDQSYFLYRLNQAQLSRALFPVGGYTKPEIRRLAREMGLPTHAKKDSQGICFIGQIDVRRFLMDHIKAEAGDVVLAGGEVVGRHAGLPFYTIGQREGIGIGGTGPYYVTGKDLPGNRLVVTNDPQDPALRAREFRVEGVSWTSGEAPALPARAGVAIRYNHRDYPALISAAENGTIHVTFEESQRAVTPGQAAVFYRGEELIGGGTIA